jgi:hypothetical protein
MTDDPYAVRTFEEFWPHYVRLHSKPETQALHAVASLTFGALALGGVALRKPLLIALAPLADYAIAQTSHRLFEKNRTAPWKNHAWHARAELRMLRLVLRGQMRAEVQRVAPPPGSSRSNDETRA